MPLENTQILLYSLLMPIITMRQSRKLAKRECSLDLGPAMLCCGRPWKNMELFLRQHFCGMQSNKMAAMQIFALVFDMV